MINISKIRKQRGLSQKIVSKLVGIPVRQLETIESGEPISGDIKNKLATVLGVPIYALSAKNVHVAPLPTDFRTTGNRIASIHQSGLDSFYRAYTVKNFSNFLKKELSQDTIYEKFISQYKRNKYDDINFQSALSALLKYNFSDALELNDAYRLFYKLRYNAESHGISVIAESLKGDQFRGFCLHDQVTPIVHLNITNQHNRMRIFTLVHELVHIIANETGIVDPFNNLNKLESFCNKVTAEFLMPKEQFGDWIHGQDASDIRGLVNDVASKLPFSKFAIAIRIAEIKGNRSLIGKWLSSVGNKNFNKFNFDTFDAKFDFSDSDAVEIGGHDEEIESGNSEDTYQPHHTAASYQVARLGFGVFELLQNALDHDIVSRFDIKENLNIRPNVIDDALSSFNRKRKEVRGYASS